MKCVDSSEVMRLFAGKLSVERAELVNTHFDHCDQCAVLRDEIGAMTSRLQHDPDEFKDEAAAFEVMTLIRMGKAEKPEVVPSRFLFWKSWQTWLLVPATAAATAVLMMVLWSPTKQDATDGFQARGAETINLNAWVSLQVFRAGKNGYEPVRDVIAADDALAFSYLNRSDSQLRYLAVFAVDNQGEVFWYYPPNVDAGNSPGSVSVQSGAQPIELPEQVAHHLRIGLLRIFGVFSKDPLSVQFIEAQAGRDFVTSQTVERMTRVSLPDVGQYSLLLRVENEMDREPN